MTDLMNYLYSNKLIKKDYSIDIIPFKNYDKPHFVYGLKEIKYIISDNYVVIFSNSKINESILLLLNMAIEGDKIVVKNIEIDLKYPFINNFIQLTQINFFDKKIFISKNSIIEAQFRTAYLISPYLPDSFYLDMAYKKYKNKNI